MLDAMQFARSPLGIRERRTRARRHLPALTYLNLDDLAEGVVSNISEDGLAVSAASVLPDESLTRLRIYFRDPGDWVEVSGRIAWKSESGKEAGIRFLDVPESARQYIRRWIVDVPSCNNSSPESSTSQGDQRPPASDTNCLSQDSVEEDGTHSMSVSTDPQALREEVNSVEAKTSLFNAGDISADPAWPGGPPPTGERRACPRTRIVPLGFIQLGENNGGIAFNVSEGGVAITAAVVIADDYVPSLRIQFPDSSDWIETSGQVAWRSESRKEAGIRFVGLAREAQEKLRTWILSQVPPAQVERPGHGAWEDQAPGLELPDALHLETVTSAPPPEPTVRGHGKASPLLLPRFPASRDLSPPPAVPASYTPAPLHTTYVSPEKPPYFQMFPLQSSVEQARKHSAFWFRKWMTFAVWAGLTVFVGWIATQSTLQRRDRTRLATRVTQTSLTPNPAGTSTTQPAKIPSAARHNLEPLVPRAVEPESVRVNNKNEDSVGDFAQDSRQPVAAKPSPAKPFPQSRNVKAPTRGLENPRPGLQVTTAAATPLIVVNKPAVPNRRAEEKVSPPFENLRETQPQLADKIASFVNSAPLPPQYVGPSERETPKQNESPATPLNAIGSIAIRTDPYPAIRMSAQQNPKKPRHTSSLQLGRLISRVEPIYPNAAKQQGIEGTVTIHAIIGRDGSVESVSSTKGPSLLASAAMNAVRQWRYSQTLVAGQPVETEEDIAVTFRLSTPAPTKK